MEGSINRQLQNADLSRTRAEAAQVLRPCTSADVANTITTVGIPAQRQAASVGMVAELEKAGCQHW
ncbi:MAG: hypothetical protein IPN53_24060 [Comamonadaceae bacterium]|nr:hypothetical protein [Comamonadaceae bacterium]